jgi:glutamate racemase
LLFFDSGVGGLAYFDWMRQHYPSYPIIYIADSQHFPYGIKDVPTLRHILTQLSQQLSQCFDIMGVFVACNTASVNALDIFQNTFHVPVVGVVPQLNLAQHHSKSAILATASTIAKLQQQPMSMDPMPYLRPAPELVTLVEYEWFFMTPSQQRQALLPLAHELAQQNVQQVFLGCTHFVHCKPILSKLLPHVQWLDGVDSIGQGFAQQLHLQYDTHTPAPSHLYQTITSAAHQHQYQAVCQYFGITYAGFLHDTCRP